MLNVVGEKVKEARCLMVGPFPPPVHGFSVANEAMKLALESRGLRVETFNTATDGSIVHQLVARIRTIISYAIALASRGRNKCLYLAVSGGKGQFSDLVFVLLARIFRLRIVMHHHSFAYIDSKRHLTQALTWLGGSGALHILLCSNMAKSFTAQYACAGRDLVMSNAVLLDLARRDLPGPRPLKIIGFIGNITLDKGIDRFLELLAKLRESNIEIKGLVAGPITEKVCGDLITKAEADGLVSYIGPAYGERKAHFFSETDVLLFPSRYPNEAEPFVIHEALVAGVPVIASERGCIGNLISPDSGVLLDREALDLTPALQQIRRWITFPEEFNRSKASAMQLAGDVRGQSQASLDALILEMVDESGAQRGH